MNLLLDTCTLIWLASEPERLGAEAAAVIDDPASVLHVSHASLWEIAVKHGAGKLSRQTLRACGGASRLGAGD